MSGTIGFFLCLAALVFDMWLTRTELVKTRRSLSAVLARLREIEDARPVNKIEIRSDPDVPRGQLFALDDGDLKKWGGK